MDTKDDVSIKPKEEISSPYFKTEIERKYFEHLKKSFQEFLLRVKKKNVL